MFEDYMWGRPSPVVRKSSI